MEAERREGGFLITDPETEGRGLPCCSLHHPLKIVVLEEFSGKKKKKSLHMFNNRLVCGTLQQKTEREWVLGLLRQGMRDKHCFELCARRGVLHIILSFFGSPLCDEAAQVGAPRA